MQKNSSMTNSTTAVNNEEYSVLKVPGTEDGADESDNQESPAGMFEANMAANEPDDMSDVRAPSPDPLPTSSTNQTPEPIKHRQNIASLCNPNNEESDIRSPQLSQPFLNNLDAVRKPFWIGESTCEHSCLYTILF